MNKRIENYIHEHSYKQLKAEFRIFLSKMKEEGVQTKQAYNLVHSHIESRTKLSPEEKHFVETQFKDVLKTLGLISVTLLPAGTLFLILLKLFKLNRYVLPSIFLDCPPPVIQVPCTTSMNEVIDKGSGEKL